MLRKNQKVPKAQINSQKQHSKSVQSQYKPMYNASKRKIISTSQWREVSIIDGTLETNEDEKDN